MERIYDSLPDKDSLDNQHLRQKEQHSDWSFHITQVQVQNKPASFLDVGNQFHDNRNQHSSAEKNITHTKAGEFISQGQLPFAVILRGIIPKVDKERGAQLLKLYSELRRNEITRCNFIRLVKDIVGSELFAGVVKRLQMKASSPESSVDSETEATVLGKRCDHHKPREESPTPVAPSGKRQKTAEGISTDSVNELNDVTAVVGIDLKDEQEKLFSGCQGQTSNILSRVVPGQEPLILQKSPLQRKLLNITSRCGVRSYSKDVESCLSLSVEERIRGLIRNLVKISRQRVDFEKEGHKIHVTSDVRHQIEVLNQIYKDQEQIRLGKPKGGYQDVSDVEMESTCQKISSEANELNRKVSALNVAVRAAVGGEDLTLKWKLMAMESLKKNEKKLGPNSDSQPAMSHKPPTPNKFYGGKESEGKGTKSPSKPARAQKAMHNICIKDIIAVLEMEPQKSKSLNRYYLYQRRDAQATNTL